MSDNRQGPILIVEPCGCTVGHGIPTRCAQHQLRPIGQPGDDFDDPADHCWDLGLPIEPRVK